jgi:hypothetical protein
MLVLVELLQLLRWQQLLEFNLYSTSKHCVALQRCCRIAACNNRCSDLLPAWS